ncbi:hypothetical protein GMOD_00006790 [Pyrenophora seminiperda CCB06]|uniref:Uncharacterized protein n=1 Tax=Pyrenophora seminiperda CCB06 TaxID=1302712 RepID=A0A3M7MB84_9PLEO|nr:hypothetical protein GMOD_00006790 [Pyrenophora seminiperda CCB06]
MEDAVDADARSSEAGPETLDRVGHGHSRSRSGGILASFLRSSKDDGTGKAPAALNGSDDIHHAQEAEGAKKASSMAAALRQSQGQAIGRQRKGSLRKAAMAKMRERSSSLRKPKTPTIITTTAAANTTGADPADKAAPPARFSYENAPLNSSSDSGWLPAVSLLASPPLATHPARDRDRDRNAAPPLLASPVAMMALYASTTDDDDVTSFYRPSAASSDFAFTGPSQGPGTSLAHRRSTRSSRRTSVSAIATPAEIDPAEEWDYGETEWWGWVVLIVTWVVFVVGMGSCLGVWSWAWDVGETPYAPPDLEDDATLPITGYYPALIVCTAVTSWVWVVVAWVGMKYFRHAKVGVDA